MIYTVTVNPCIDRLYYFDEIKRNDVNRPKKTGVISGGKGINVSKALNVLGEENKAIIISGGRSGIMLEELLKEEGINFCSVKCNGETRTNLMIRGTKNEEEIRINEYGPIINSEVERELIKKLDIIKENDIVVLSGSLPEGVKEDFYKKIGDIIVNNKKARVVIDSDLEEMKFALECKLFMIKPNKEELMRLSGKSGSIEDLIELCDKKEIKYGFLTDGKKGGYLYFNKKVYKMIPPEVTAITTVGAGDSFIGGFLSCINAGKDIKDAVKMALALSAAKVEGKFIKDRVNELFEKALIEEIVI